MIPIHPRIVHFPVAFLIGAALFGILALIFKSKRNVFKEALFWNLALGVAGTVVAVITGLLEEESLVHNDTIHSILETHELLGFIFSGIFLAVLIWLILRKSKMKDIEFTGMVVVLILSTGLLGYSAHLGGKMVYEQGAGVIPMENIISKEEHNHSHDAESTHHHDESENSQMNNEKENNTQDHDNHEHGSHDHNGTENKK